MENLVTFSDSVDQNSKISLYMRVFGEAPWNEGYVCPGSGQLYSLSSNQTECVCCPTPMPTKPFYTSEELQSVFSLLEKKRGYQEQIAFLANNAEPIGFIWGWRSDLNEINADKLKLDTLQLEALKSGILQAKSDFSLEDFYYFAEIGIRAENRNTDIAGGLYRAQIASVLDSGGADILVRTTKKTDVPYQWFLRMGYIPVFDYNDQQERVILIK